MSDDNGLASGMLDVRLDRSEFPWAKVTLHFMDGSESEIRVKWRMDITEEQGHNLSAIVENLGVILDAFVSGIESDDPIVAINLP